MTGGECNRGVGLVCGWSEDGRGMMMTTASHSHTWWSVEVCAEHLPLAVVSDRRVWCVVWCVWCVWCCGICGVYGVCVVWCGVVCVWVVRMVCVVCMDWGVYVVWCEWYTVHTAPCTSHLHSIIRRVRFGRWQLPPSLPVPPTRPHGNAQLR